MLVEIDIPNKFSLQQKSRCLFGRRDDRENLLLAFELLDWKFCGRKQVLTYLREIREGQMPKQRPCAGTRTYIHGSERSGSESFPR